ncbi:MAG: hypothetical protein JO340_12410 [Acidobacteriaceae bacterium]|nr:hypothetical protein [Acidobacteriaceae bacterium]
MADNKADENRLDALNSEPGAIADDEIVTERRLARRSFLASSGVFLTGAAGIVSGLRATTLRNPNQDDPKKPDDPDKRPDDPDKRPADPDKRPADPDKKPEDREKRPEDRERKAADPDKRPPDPDRKPADPDKPPASRG